MARKITIIQHVPFKELERMCKKAKGKLRDKLLAMKNLYPEVGKNVKEVAEFLGYTPKLFITGSSDGTKRGQKD